MATVELRIVLPEVPDEVAGHACTEYFSYTIPYHHAMPVEAWRESIAHDLELAAARIRAGENDPPREEPHE